jgi:hypothetical protein
LAINALTAGMLAYVSALTWKRKVAPTERGAMRAFAVWWAAAAAVLFLTIARTALAMLGVQDLAPYVAMRYALAAPLAIAVWGLLYYLLYLYTGTRRVLWPLTAAYVGVFAYFLWYFSQGGAPTLQTTDWDVRLVSEPSPGPQAASAFGLVFGLPVIVATLAYGSLFFRVKERTQRWRIGMVSLGFLQLFGMVVVGFLAGWNKRDWYPLTYQLPALAASVMFLLAYHPPEALRARLRLEPLALHSD